ncbi:MAG: glycoside hydrolase family 2 protein [Clostridia bacterium]|nr:glycoside hydrolase family 2 protein [Clostridia bacterium]
MRKIIHLNYDWKYLADFREEFIDTGFDDSGFETVMLPHANIETPYNNFSDKLLQFKSCYRRRLKIGEKDQGKRVILHFEGVMAYALVYLNGQIICEHKGGYTPFKCDITGQINYGGDNLLVVMVDSTERPDIPPFGHVVDYLTYGGMYREVWIELVSEIYIENMFVKTRDVLAESKKLDIGLYMKNHTGQSHKLNLQFSLLKDDREVLAFGCEKQLTEGNVAVLDVMQAVREVLLWDNICPNLYDLIAEIKMNNRIVDRFTVRFGFREARFRSDGFYLNGRRMKLRGLNRHQAFPYVGYAMPKSAQYKDAEILKNELGVNVVRLSHYPQSKHFLDRCDELGLLVFEEIPGWQHIGDAEWQDVAVKNVEEMIKRDWNRPSIILWGVRINESQDNDEFYKKTNNIAKALDDTRQTGGVRNFAGSHLFEDVYTYNDFIHRGGDKALCVPRAVTKKKVPYLVTEHNGHMFPTKKFDNEAGRVEHCLRHLKVLESMYSAPDISGAIGWCMFDYNTHKDFGSGDGICYHGVTDMFRIPKEAAAVYASQQDGRPVLEVASSMDIGEREAGKLDTVYVFTNCDYLKLYKNGVYIGTYYPAREVFAHVPHPPVIITDFIGDLIEKNEAMTPKDAGHAKKILYAIMKYGDKELPLRYKIRMLRLMLKYRMSLQKAVSTFAPYVTNWGCESLEYEFEGYIDHKAVIKVKKGPFSSGDLLVVPDKDGLFEDETYDVCRVVIKHTDESGNTLTYSNEAVSLEIEGEGEIIGPKNIALIGGSRAFWVKSTGKKGNVKVTIRSDRFEPKIVEFKVEKK